SIFALTLTVIISLATYFFKTDNEVRIMENGLSLVNILGAKVQTDIAALVDKGRQLAVTLNQNFESKERRNFFINLFFENDPNFIMLGVYKKESDHLVELSKVFNDRHLHDSKISGADLDELIKKHEAAFLKTFNGKPVIYNASPGAKEKIFAMGIPAASSGNTNAILIMLVKLEKIQSAFEKSGEFETFLVNREGLVIAHKDEKVTLAGADFSDLPIVKNMQASAANNGQIKYKDAAGKNYLGSFKKMGFGDGGIIATVSEDKAFEAVYNIQQRNIYIMVIALSLSLIIVFFFAKSISKPVLKLLSATLKISKGDFKVDIESTTKDEVGVLTNYFIKMGQGLEEREKVKSILGSMIDPTVVKEAMIDMAALKRGSEKKITAFFSDVAGFSTISEQLTSIELAALLNEYLGSMTIILKKYDGVLDKYIGDAIVGIFNAPVDIAEPALSAARASLEMIDKLTELRKYWTENDLYSKDSHVMDVRIGLNTGVAKVGFMGTDALASYTMMGDTVNLAARLEAAGKDYGVNILISQMTKEEVEGEMFTRELDVVRVKGKNEPVKIFELISTKSNVDPKVAEATELYNRGFQLYLSQNWTDAIDKFQKSQKVKGTKDKACSMLIHRCEDYKLDPPGKDWDGVFTRTHK
ncbi:MAG: HAMP domain-containing protein, partial [Leptospira sp.]|nr:HAMP domain-containing protein [Leptospira sp.]